MAASHLVTSHSCSLPRVNRQHLIEYSNLSAVPNPGLYFAGEFWLPSRTADVHRPFPLDRMRFRKGRVHESDNTSRRIAAGPSVIAKNDRLKSTEHAELNTVGMNTCQTEVSTGKS